MNKLLPYQQRVVVEKAELDAKLESLHKFIFGELFKTIVAAEQERLTRQYEIMKNYSHVLNERIWAFDHE